MNCPHRPSTVGEPTTSSVLVLKIVHVTALAVLAWLIIVKWVNCHIVWEIPKQSNMIQQTEFTLSAKRRGFHLVTREILSNLPTLPKTGLLNLFVQHTSCALSINENADPDVRSDMEQIFNRLVKENEPYYDHVLEGSDDMPAHAKKYPLRCEYQHSHHERSPESRHMARNLSLRVPWLRRWTSYCSNNYRRIILW